MNISACIKVPHEARRFEIAARLQDNHPIEMQQYRHDECVRLVREFDAAVASWPGTVAQQSAASRLPPASAPASLPLPAAATASVRLLAWKSLLGYVVNDKGAKQLSCSCCVACAQHDCEGLP
jgi:hypothetical protein